MVFLECVYSLYVSVFVSFSHCVCVSDCVKVCVIKCANVMSLRKINCVKFPSTVKIFRIYNLL